MIRENRNRFSAGVREAIDTLTDGELAEIENFVLQFHPERKIQRCGPLTFEHATGKAAVNGDVLHLTHRERSVLSLLFLRQGNVVSKNALMDHLYSTIAEPDIKIVDIWICKIRRKIELAGASRNLIKTVWADGYYIEKDTPAEMATEGVSS